MAAEHAALSGTDLYRLGWQSGWDEAIRIGAIHLPAGAQQTARQGEPTTTASARPSRNRKRGQTRAPRPPRSDITAWVADRNARRVPNFVQALTGGLDTKKKIVARYGEGARFEAGKPAPAILHLSPGATTGATPGATTKKRNRRRPSTTASSNSAQPQAQA